MHIEQTRVIHAKSLRSVKAAYFGLLHFRIYVFYMACISHNLQHSAKFWDELFLKNQQIQKTVYL